MGTYPLFTDATADLSDRLISEMPSVKIIPMQVEIGGTNIHTHQMERFL